MCFLCKCAVLTALKGLPLKLTALFSSPQFPKSARRLPSLSYDPVCPIEFRFTAEEGLDWNKVSTFGKLFPWKETYTGVEEIENNASPKYRAKMQCQETQLKKSFSRMIASLASH